VRKTNDNRLKTLKKSRERSLRFDRAPFGIVFRLKRFIISFEFIIIIQHYPALRLANEARQAPNTRYRYQVRILFFFLTIILEYINTNKFL